MVSVSWLSSKKKVTLCLATVWLQDRFRNQNIGSFVSCLGIARGAGSEVWSRVYMITPVRKLGRVRLSTNFPSKHIWWKKDDEFLLSFKFFRFQTSRKGFHELFYWNFWTSGGMMYEQFVGDFTFRDSASRQVQLILLATTLLHLLYFSVISGIKTLFHIVNTCYEHTTLVWVLQQSCEWSLNQFSTSLFISLFVHWEPQQIFMGLNTEYRANLVKARVNVPLMLLHMY